MIKLIVLDVDGCLSDGKLIYSNDAIESKAFNVKDGLGIATWIKLGNEVVIITGRESKVVQTRAKELGIKYLFQGIKDKRKVLKELLETLNIDFNNVGVIGDDLNDFNMLKLAKRSFTPKDSVKEIREMVDTVLDCNGGDGAVRQMIDILIDENDQREQFMAMWI